MFSTFCKPPPQLKFLLRASHSKYQRFKMAVCVCVCVSVGVCVTDCCSPLSGFLWLLHMDEALPPSARLCMSPCAQEEPKERRNIHMHACISCTGPCLLAWRSSQSDQTRVLHRTRVWIFSFQTRRIREENGWQVLTCNHGFGLQSWLWQLNAPQT